MSPARPIILLAMIMSIGVSYGQVVEVTPENMNGWSFGSFNTDTGTFPG
jgi:hypothetical protein